MSIELHLFNVINFCWEFFINFKHEFFVVFIGFLSELVSTGYFLDYKSEWFRKVALSFADALYKKSMSGGIDLHYKSRSPL